MPEDSIIGHNLGETIDEYLRHCRARGLSPRTIEDGYGYALRQVLLPWCIKNRIAEVTAIDTDALMRWQTELLEQPGKRGRPISRYSIEGWVKAVNTFLKWAKQDARGSAPRPPRTLIEVLSREEVERLEERAQAERDKLIVRVLADTGIRASELLGLRAADLMSVDRGFYIRVRGKGNKERLVPAPKLAERLRRFARGREGRLFMGLHRRPAGDYEPLTLSGLQKMLRALGRESEIGKRVHPHIFRHSFATWALSRGMNPIQLADILGHSSLVMIQRNYAHLSNRDAYDAMVRALAKD